ncbi:MAG: hypothetical protein IJ056_07690, partial [Acidaminococcaceae bacterium]|nr:hypothetical protein [Acidaminococcaceae bacterium]
CYYLRHALLCWSTYSTEAQVVPITFLESIYSFDTLTNIVCYNGINKYKEGESDNGHDHQ